MDRQQLKERLVAAGVPEGNYFILGIDSQLTPGKGGGFGELGLTQTEDKQGWRLIVEERGRIQREWVFATEEEACEAAWEKLKPHDRPVKKLSPEEWERARALARKTIADYREADKKYRSGNEADSGQQP